MVCIKA